MPEDHLPVAISVRAPKAPNAGGDVLGVSPLEVATVRLTAMRCSVIYRYFMIEDFVCTSLHWIAKESIIVDGSRTQASRTFESI